MKKISVIILSLVLCVVLFAACGQNANSGNDSGPAPAASSGDMVDAVFMCMDMANESQAFASRMFERHGPNQGFNITVMDNKADPTLDAQSMNTAVAQGAKVIFTMPNDPIAIVPSLMAAQEAGVVLIAFGSDVSEENQKFRDSYIGSNDFLAGQVAGDYFKEHFPNGANIVEIGGQAGHDAAVKRHEGFAEAIAGSSINVLDYQACSAWSANDAMNIMQDFIVKFGDQIEGIFCHWDNGFTGVIQAIEAAGLSTDDFFSIAIDGNRAGFDQVRAGQQKVSLMQDFEAMAITAMELANKVMAGETVQSVNYAEWVIITLDTIDDYQYPEW